MVEILHFSDIAVDHREPSLTEPEADALRAELRSAFSRICQLAVELNVHALCCAGNLFDQNSATEDTFEFLRDGFARLGGVTVFLAPGATDWLAAGSPYWRSGFWSDNVHVFTEARLRDRPLGEVTLWGAGYTTPAPPAGFLDDFPPIHEGIHVALFHGHVASTLASPGPAPFTAAQIRSGGLRHALVGGLARPHSAAEFTYPGRPAPRREVARTGGGAVQVRIDGGGTVERQWHDVAAGYDSGAGSGAGRGFAAGYDSGADAVPAWLAELLRPEHPADADYRLDAIGRERTVRAEFVRAVRAARLGEDEAPVLRAGLLAVDGRLGPEAM